MPSVHTLFVQCFFKFRFSAFFLLHLSVLVIIKILSDDSSHVAHGCNNLSFFLQLYSSVCVCVCQPSLRQCCIVFHVLLLCTITNTYHTQGCLSPLSQSDQVLLRVARWLSSQGVWIRDREVASSTPGGYVSE